MYNKNSKYNFDDYMLTIMNEVLKYANERILQLVLLM